MIPCLQNPAKFIVALCSIGMACSTSLALAGAVEGESTTQSVEMAYEFYVGPLHVLSMQATLALSEDSYELTSFGETRGITNLIFNMENTTESLGERGQNGMEPTYYRQQSDSRWGEWMVEMSYQDGNIFKLVTDPNPEDEGVLPVSPEDMANTIDPMAAFLLGAREASPGDCAQTIGVFDGRRRYDLEFSAADPDAIEKADRKDLPRNDNFFWCQLQFKRVSGFEDWEREEDEASRERRERRENDPVIMLLGYFDQGKITLPIYGRIKSDFGTARTKLTKLTINGVSMLDEIGSVNLEDDETDEPEI